MNIHGYVLSDRIMPNAVPVRDAPAWPHAVPVLGVPVFKLPEMVRRLLYSIDFPVSELVIVENGPVDAESDRMMRAFLKKQACGPPSHVTFDGDGAPAWKPGSLQGAAKQCISQTSLIWRTTTFSLKRSDRLARTFEPRSGSYPAALKACVLGLDTTYPEPVQTWAARTHGTSSCAMRGGYARRTR